MSTPGVLQSELAAEDSGSGDDLVHVVCECDDNVALCGAKVLDAHWVLDGYDDSRDCVVCLDLEDQGCEGCSMIGDGLHA